MKRLVFLHASKIGDLIYALPTIKTLCLKHNSRAIIVCLQYQVVEALRSLLIEENYVLNITLLEDFHLYLTKERRTNIIGWANLEGFREFDMGMDSRDSLPICYAKAFKVENKVKELIKDSWITRPGINNNYLHKGTLINYTPRYQDKLFSWKEVIQNSPKPYFFAGTSGEYKIFTERYPKIEVEHVIFKDYKQAAEIFCTIRMFIGNQSSLFALAEAMKIPRKLIEAPSPPNCRISPEVVVNKITRKIHRVLSLMWLIGKVIFNKHY